MTTIIAARRLVCVGLFLFVAAKSPPLTAAPPTPEAVDEPSVIDALPADANWSEIIEALLLEAIPQDYEDLRHWGKKTEVFDGFRVRGLRISKRTKDVNHGLWRRYRVRLLHPEKTFDLEVRDLQPAGRGRFTFRVVVTARARCHVKLTQWALGVKGLSTSSEADVRVRMWADCSLGIRTERPDGQWLPDLVFEPDVHRIRLSVLDVDVRRIGPIGGTVAEEIGDGSRLVVEDLLRQREGKLVRKARKVIDRKRDRFRVSITKLRTPGSPETPVDDR
ncbi:hypothetical protein Mal4_32490 [Maioricimonas rarisocia]|uniref:Uncharacterized protein n=1 Tax=Maioricimonas rarisocia TaxID=2528026 RepID=A0A517Z8V2_9PLAN|nr:hypothetical protein [Maioricimonas rarisocia]QDU38917.1 hypothetical protein Mal4_32490 [Maioricimonas rarisocia]